MSSVISLQHVLLVSTSPSLQILDAPSALLTAAHCGTVLTFVIATQDSSVQILTHPPWPVPVRAQTHKQLKWK